LFFFILFLFLFLHGSMEALPQELWDLVVSFLTHPVLLSFLATCFLSYFVLLVLQALELCSLAWVGGGGGHLQRELVTAARVCRDFHHAIFANPQTRAVRFLIVLKLLIRPDGLQCSA
jgi:hypothetical protein